MSDSLSKTLIDLTGNIFVDQGQLNLKILLKKLVNEEISIQDINTLSNSSEIYGFKWLATNLIRFKSFSMLYTTNHPRYQASFKQEREKIFYAYLKALGMGVVREFDHKIPKSFKCEICNRNHDFNFDVEYRRVLKNNYSNYKRDKEEPKFSCREFFPLAGTMGSESQSFSNMSMTLNICPRCLLMIYYLPFSAQVIEGHLAIFQISDIALQYKLSKIIIQKYIEKIQSSSLSSSIDNIGQELKSKTERIFATFNDLNELILPENPTRKDFLTNFPNKVTGYWLWKFTNSGQGGFLEYEHIPSATIIFIYLCSYFDLGEELIQMIKQEIKDIKYPPKQFYNCIRSKRLYEFEKLDVKKYQINIKLVFLYYYYILGYSKPELDVLIRVVLDLIDKIKERENIDEIKRYIRKKGSMLIYQSIRDLISNNSIDLKDYWRTFSFEVKSDHSRMTQSIIFQLIQLNLLPSAYNDFIKHIEIILEGDFHSDFTQSREFIISNLEENIIGCVAEFFTYFQTKYHNDKTLIERKMIDRFSRKYPLGWFISIYSKIALLGNINCSYPRYVYLLENSGGWFNLKFLFELILIAFNNGQQEPISFIQKEYNIPEVYILRYSNPNLERIIVNYFNIRNNEKGLSYMEKNFMIPLIQGKITLNYLREGLEKRSELIGYDPNDWDNLLINPETGVQDINYFFTFIKIFIGNLIAKHKNDSSFQVEVRQEGLKKSEIIESDDFDDNKIGNFDKKLFEDMNEEEEYEIDENEEIKLDLD